jgi:hypothetical protein
MQAAGSHVNNRPAVIPTRQQYDLNVVMG